MSGRFVRASKYRHVHGDEPKKDGAYVNLRPQCTGDGNFVAASTKFVSVPVQGGGGPVLIQDITKTGRIEHNAPTLNVHKAKVLDMAWSPFNDNMILTGGDDCAVRLSIIPDGGLTSTLETAAASLDGHQKKVHTVNFHPTASNVCGTAGYDMCVKVWDYEKQAAILSYDTPEHVADMKWNSDGSLLGMTTKDKKIRIYDPRAAEGIVEADGFAGTKAAKFEWMDNIGKIACVGFNRSSMRQYAVYDPRNMSAPLDVTDIDQSAGVMMTYFDPDTSILFIGGKGDGNLRYLEAVDEAPYLHFLSEFRSSQSQKGLGWMPKRGLNVSKCEIARCFRLTRDAIYPISLCVPRKSEMFQADIYPDTYAGDIMLTADEWFAGGNKQPATASMKPGESAAKASVAFTAQKGPAELSAELATANKKIAALEKEVAKWKALANDDSDDE